MLHSYFSLKKGLIQMRVQEYKDAKTIVSNLYGVATRKATSVISGSSMESIYKLIVEQYTGISTDDIKRVYTLGKINDIYHILVVLSNRKTQDVFRYNKCGIIRTTSLQRISYFDAHILLAGDDIYDDLNALYKILSRIFISPEDDMYTMYCFLEAFKGIYTDDDIKAIMVSMTVDAANAMKILLNNNYSSDYILNEEDIAEALKEARSKSTDSGTIYCGGDLWQP